MITELILFGKRVLVTEMEFGVVTTSGGLILTDDDGKSSGIKSRWGRVYKVGPDVSDLNEGDYVLLKHGRWTRNYEVDLKDEGKIMISMIDYPDAVLVVSKEKPEILKQVSKNY